MRLISKRPKRGLLLHQGRIGIRGLGLVGVYLAIIFRIKRTMVGVHVLGSHGEGKTVLLSLETYRIVAAVWVDHALLKRSPMHQLWQRGGVVSVFLVEEALGSQYDSHITQGQIFRIGTGRVAAVLGLVGRRRRLCLGRRGVLLRKR